MIIDELFEGPQLCPECGGISFYDLILAEKKDACYYKVKASAKVWPSAYASGRLVQCRKKGAANYGKSKTESVAEGLDDIQDTRQFRNAIALAKSQKAIRQAKDGKDAKYYADGTKVTPAEVARRAAERKAKKQGVAEGSGNWYVRVKGKVLKDKQFNAIPFPSKETATQKAFEIHNKKRIPLDMIKLTQSWMDGPETQGMAEQQELDEKWSQKYKKSINCANPKGFSQRAHCAGRKKNEDVEESLGKQIHSTFQTMGDSFSDAHLAKGISYFLQGRHQEGENWLRGKIPPEAQAAVFGKLKTLQAQGGVDVNKNPRVQQYIDDKLVPWVKSQIQQNVKEGEQQKGADYRDPKEVDYDDEYDAMVARVKKLAGLGPLKTVYDPKRRVYRNMPTAVQPLKK